MVESTSIVRVLATPLTPPISRSKSSRARASSTRISRTYVASSLMTCHRTRSNRPRTYWSIKHCPGTALNIVPIQLMIEMVAEHGLTRENVVKRET